MNGLVKEVLQGFVLGMVTGLDAGGGKEKLIRLAEQAFDAAIEPIDLPGPDQIVDPLLRKAIAPIVSAMYDGLMKQAKTLAA